MFLRLTFFLARCGLIGFNSLPSHFSRLSFASPQLQNYILLTLEGVATSNVAKPRILCSTSSTQQQCWSCKRQLPDKEFFCECGKIQPLEQNWTYFEALGYSEPTVHIDSEDLARRMREMQKLLHPDKFTRATPYEQKLATDAATFVNRAYATLERPGSLFTYVLSLHHPTDEESSGSNIMDPDFLAEMLELNEEVQEFTELLTAVNEKRHDPTDLSQPLKQLLDRITQDLRTERVKLVTAIDKAKWNNAQISLTRYRYLSRILDRLKEYELDWQRVGIDVDVPTV